MGWELIEVEGVPVTQGSIAYKGHRGKRAVLLNDHHDELRAWRLRISTAARQALGVSWEPLDEPVRLGLVFTIPRPKRPRFDVPATRPDIDKLLRAVFDGLADGGVYREDSRVYGIDYLEEQYETPEQCPGVVVSLRWGASLAPGLGNLGDRRA